MAAIKWTPLNGSVLLQSTIPYSLPDPEIQVAGGYAGLYELHGGRQQMNRMDSW